MSDISVCSDENEEQDFECEFDKTKEECKQQEEKKKFWYGLQDKER